MCYHRSSLLRSYLQSSRYMKDKDVLFIQINISTENCHAMKNECFSLDGQLFDIIKDAKLLADYL